MGAFAPGQAEMALEEVVAPEGEEGLLLRPTAPPEHLADGGAEVVVGDALGDPAERGEGGQVAGEEALLPRRGEGTDEGLERVAQAEAEEVGGLERSRVMGTPKLALLWATKREILRSVLRFFPLKCGSTCHLQVAAPCTL